MFDIVMKDNQCKVQMEGKFPTNQNLRFEKDSKDHLIEMKIPFTGFETSNHLAFNERPQ